MSKRPIPAVPPKARAVAASLAVLWLLGGCASMDRRELTWQAVHAVDVAQTLNAASDPCYQEEAWLTRRLIGAQPSDAEVLAWGVGTAVFHAWISDALEARGAPRWVQKVWELGTLGHTSYAVGTNHQEGVRPFGDNEPVPGCFAS
jgi:hypothetical protein